jgi:hypothetical protein
MDSRMCLESGAEKIKPSLIKHVIDRGSPRLAFPCFGQGLQGVLVHHGILAGISKFYNIKSAPYTKKAFLKIST